LTPAAAGEVRWGENFFILHQTCKSTPTLPLPNQGGQKIACQFGLPVQQQVTSLESLQNYMKLKQKKMPA